MKKQCILVTGGAGFIGSHTCIALHEAGYKVIIVDNFSNSHRDVLSRLNQILNTDIIFYEGDVRDQIFLAKIFKNHAIHAVIHFAGFKAVGESVKKPLDYYDNNILSMICLLRVMKEARVYILIFSSSATVYGDPKWLPIKEDSERYTTSPYGRSKLFIEHLLEDLYHAEPHWNIALLRYFNPVGAHDSGLIGELPNDVPNNLMPFVQQVAKGLQPYLSVFGNDYDTRDGTGIRDYIHVMDLAEGHVSALNYYQTNHGLLTVNLGTGQGTSVLDLVNTFEKINNCKVQYKIVERRSGDIAACWADVSFAERALAWRAKRDLAKMCEDAWRWECARTSLRV